MKDLAGYNISIKYRGVQIDVSKVIKFKFYLFIFFLLSVQLVGTIIGFNFNQWTVVDIFLVLALLGINIILFKKDKFDSISQKSFSIWALISAFCLLLFITFNFEKSLPLSRDEMSDIDLSLQHTPSLACALQSQPPIHCALVKTFFSFLEPTFENVRIMSLAIATFAIFLFFLIILELSHNWFIALLVSILWIIWPVWSGAFQDLRPYLISFIAFIFWLRTILIVDSSENTQFAALSFISIFTIGFQPLLVLLGLLFYYLFFKNKARLLIVVLDLVILVGFTLFLIKNSNTASSGLKLSLFDFQILNQKFQSLTFLPFVLIYFFYLFVSKFFNNLNPKQIKLSILVFVFAVFYVLVVWTTVNAPLVGRHHYSIFLILFLAVVLFKYSVPVIIVSYLLTFHYFGHFRLDRFDYNLLKQSSEILNHWTVVCFEKDTNLCFSQNEPLFFKRSYLNFSSDIVPISRDFGSIELFKFLLKKFKSGRLTMLIERNGVPQQNLLLFLDKNMTNKNLRKAKNDRWLVFSGTDEEIKNSWFEILDLLAHNFPDNKGIDEYLLHKSYFTKDKANYEIIFDKIKNEPSFNQYKINFYQELLKDF